MKETFHANLAETELKEWMIHPNNSEVRQSIQELDRRVRFTPQRLDREDLMAESQGKFEQAILNTGRPNVMKNFPVAPAESKVSASQGALTLEMSQVDTEELDVIPKEILDKLGSKMKVNYFYPYDKFEYVLTYDGKELPMAKALLKVQKDMEDACERRTINNGEYRRWYKKNHGGDGSEAGPSGSSQ